MPSTEWWYTLFRVSDLLYAIENSAVPEALAFLDEALGAGADAWEIHDSLFPVVQRVANPPFINPHLPKMYNIFRDFMSYVEREDIPPLVRLEVTEYARRPKIRKIIRPSRSLGSVSFGEISAAFREGDREKAAALMAALASIEGREELARRLLMLGSGYLDRSLGHSVSCTAFILLEMLERRDEDPWPAVEVLAEYFCRGGFHAAPETERPVGFSAEELGNHVLRAVSGRGIVNLHHSITLYAIERVRRLFPANEYDRLIGRWVDFMQDKEAEPVTFEDRGGEVETYPDFFAIFSAHEPMPLLERAEPLIRSNRDRRRLGRYILKALCDSYQGDYNPHYLTGLGSALWLLERYGERSSIGASALFQYLDFYFTSMKRED